ncbi:MAG: exonuclease domain-containing protein [Burkholderiales bacterium]|jgi:DNA polymerase-3 subunit epsilon
MWQRFVPLDLRRRRLLRSASAGPMHDYLAASFPGRGVRYTEVEFVALDLETTGLDARNDEILSIGLVSLKAGRIGLGTAQHHLIAPTGAIPETSAVIHHITDEAAASGRDLAQVLPGVLLRLRGRVLLGHHVRIERAFLDAACKRLYGTDFLAPVADTESLIRRWLEHRNQSVTGRDLRLHALRERYGLPRYKAHNALTDALATAELFCAFVARANLGADTALRRFLEPQ